MKHYSLAVREQVLDAIDAGLSVRAAARRFGISVSTIGHWRHRQRTTGSVAAIRRPGRPPHIGPAQAAALQAQLAAHPKATLTELCARWQIDQGVQVSVGTMWRAVHAVGHPATSQRARPPHRADEGQEREHRQPGATMVPPPQDTAEFQEFVYALAGTDWQASLAHEPQTGAVCLHIDRPSLAPRAGRQTMTFCRRTFALAERSARKHVFKRPSA